MFDWLQLEFMQRALAAGLLVAAICPVIGLFLVLRRLSLIGDGLGHIAFAGVAAGFLTHIYPLVTALGFTVAGAAGIEWLRSRQKAYGDLALAILFYSGIAGGVVLSKLSGSFSGAQLFGYLFGQISTVSITDVWFILGLGIVVVAIVVLFYKELFALTFDEATARVSGIRVGALNLLLAVMAAVTVSVGMRIVGILMVAALMIVPVAAALQLGRGFKATLLWSVLFSMVSLVMGLATSYYLDLPPGGTIVLLAVGVFLLTSIFRTAVGAIARSGSRREAKTGV
jgi:zinc transport system permease protein